MSQYNSKIYATLFNETALGSTESSALILRKRHFVPLKSCQCEFGQEQIPGAFEGIKIALQYSIRSMQYAMHKMRPTEKRCQILALFCLLVVCHTSGYPSSDFHVNNENIREKRNVICFFGLTDVIKETLYASLLDVTQTDTVSIDDAYEGRLHDGHLKGLSTLTNLTALRVFCDDEDIVVFSTTLRMKDAEIWYKWSRKVVFKFKGSVWLRAREVDFDLEVRINNTCGWHFEITNSLVTKVDDFEIGFKGLGILNPVVRKVLKRKWKKDVSKKIGLLIKESLTKKLETVSSSLEWMAFL